MSRNRIERTHHETVGDIVVQFSMGMGEKSTLTEWAQSIYDGVVLLS